MQPQSCQFIAISLSDIIASPIFLGLDFVSERWDLGIFRLTQLYYGRGPEWDEASLGEERKKCSPLAVGGRLGGGRLL